MPARLREHQHVSLVQLRTKPGGSMTALLRTDGGARPKNPGHAGFGCYLQTDDGDEHMFSRYIGFATNNYAEYCGIIVGMKWAYETHGVREIEIISDSQMVVNQVLGTWQIKNDNLRPLVADCRKILDRFDVATLSWEKRDSNKVADKLATMACFWGWNQNPWVPEVCKTKRHGEVHDPFDMSTEMIRIAANPRLRFKVQQHS